MGSRSWTVASSSERRRLGRSFFERPTTQVARDLLGSVLSVRGPDGVRSVRLVEVEAYGGNDPASHAYRGLTRRNRSMFGPPGTLYVYRIHQVVCANLVTRPGEAVLLRAGAPLPPLVEDPSGPGRLCRALGITIDDDGTSVVGPGRISLIARGSSPRRGPIVRSRRVGISRATGRRLRFSVARDRWVSRPRPGAPYASPS
jgi:DNA-3-methyladenine glycosylase